MYGVDIEEWKWIQAKMVTKPVENSCKLVDELS